MNNQSKLARQILYAIRTKDNISLNKVYPLYNRYMKFLFHNAKDKIDGELLEKINKDYVNYKKEQFNIKKNDWFTWNESDARDLTDNIKKVLK